MGQWQRRTRSLWPLSKSDIDTQRTFVIYICVDILPSYFQRMRGILLLVTLTTRCKETSLVARPWSFSPSLYLRIIIYWYTSYCIPIGLIRGWWIICLVEMMQIPDMYNILVTNIAKIYFRTLSMKTHNDLVRVYSRSARSRWRARSALWLVKISVWANCNAKHGRVSVKSTRKCLAITLIFVCIFDGP